MTKNTVEKEVAVVTEHPSYTEPVAPTDETSRAKRWEIFLEKARKDCEFNDALLARFDERMKDGEFKVIPDSFQ